MKYRAAIPCRIPSDRRGTAVVAVNLDMRYVTVHTPSPTAGHFDLAQLDQLIDALRKCRQHLAFGGSTESKRSGS
ncbi:hypothetical protein GCM10022243_48600 [Saccharothrix violaceirubra]